MNKNKFFSLTMLLMIIAALFCVRVNALNPINSEAIQHQVVLHVRYENPLGSNPEPHKSPVEIPVVELDGYTLTFDSSCHGCTLNIVNADDEVEYTTVISSSTIELPSTLEGVYEIQIIQDDLCFYGDITL